MEINAETFKCEVFKRLTDVFVPAKLGANVEKQKHRLEGFMFAGEYLGLISHDEGKKLLEQAHLEVYGETVMAKQQRLETRRKALDYDDDVFFDEPAVLRNRSRTNIK